MSIDDAKLLLAEYDQFSNAFRFNEEIGERRIEFFITIATAVLGGVVVLLTSDHVRLLALSSIFRFSRRRSRERSSRRGMKKPGSERRPQLVQSVV